MDATDGAEEAKLNDESNKSRSGGPREQNWKTIEHVTNICALITEAKLIRWT